MKSLYSNLIIGQEAVCPDGLGRIIWHETTYTGQTIQIQTYINDRSCKWDYTNVRIVELKLR